MNTTDNPIYLVMYFEKCEKKASGFTALKNSRIKAFYYNLNEAINDVSEEKRNDFTTQMCDFALIEQHFPGPDGYDYDSQGSWFFKWDYDKQKYLPIETPKPLQDFVRFIF